MEFRMSRNGCSGVLEDKFGLSVEIGLNTLFQAIGVTQIRFHAQNVGHHILQANQVDQGETLCLIELRGQVNIGFGCRIAADHRAVQVEMDNPCRFQRRFQFQQFRFYEILVHIAPALLPIVPDHDASSYWGA